MKCLKCQNDTFDKVIILPKILSEESKHNKVEDKFQVLVCKKCHLTQWYNHYIVSGDKRPEIRLGKSLYNLPGVKEFKCRNCQSVHSISEIAAPASNGDSLEGEILLRICSDCGLAELYGIILVHSTNKWRAEIRIKERANIASSYICPVCLSTEVDKSGQIVFDEDEKRPHYMPISKKPFLFVACSQCKYMMVFEEYL